MAYDGVRSYVNASLVAQNVVSTASGAIATTTTIGYVPVGEPSFLVSLAGCVSGAASSNLVSNAAVYPVVYNISGTTTTTTTGQACNFSAANLAAAKGAFGTMTTSLPVQSGLPVQLITLGTGTASATETVSALSIIVGFAPQYV